MKQNFTNRLKYQMLKNTELKFSLCLKIILVFITIYLVSEIVQISHSNLNKKSGGLSQKIQNFTHQKWLTGKWRNFMIILSE